MNVFTLNEQFPIQVFRMDTPDIVSDRIVWALQTLPMFVSIIGGPLLSLPLPNSHVKAISLEQKVMEYDDLFQLILDYKEQFDPSLVLALWTILKIQVPDNVLMLLEYHQIPYSLHKYDFSSEDVFRDKHKFAVEQQSILQFYSQFESTIPLASTTPFILRAFYKAKELKSTDPAFYFNDMHTTELFPFIIYKQFHKTHGTYRQDPPIAIECQANEMIRWYHVSFKYSIVIDIGLSEINYSIEGKPPHNILVEIPSSLRELTWERSSVTSQIHFQCPELNMVLFADFCLNHTTLKHFVACSDRSQGDAETGTRYMYIQLPHKPIVRASIVQEITRSSSNVPFQIGSFYWTVRFHQIQEEDTNSLLDFMLRLCPVFLKYIPQLIPLYEEHGISLYTKNEEPIRLKLKEIEPTIFNQDYSRICQPKQAQPHIISNKEEYDYWTQQNPRELMAFPNITQQTEFQLPERIYVCPDDTYKYIGLRENIKSTLGVQPCCFKRPQTKRSIYQQYFNETTRTEKRIEDNEQTYLITTLKPLREGQRGELPVYIKRLLQVCQLQGLRLGVVHPQLPNQSILNVLNRICNKQVDHHSILPYLHLSIQTNPGATVRDLEQRLQTHQWTPIQFLPTLEHVYKAQFYFFSSTELMHPFVKHGYLTWNNEHTPVYMIFYHNGVLEAIDIQASQNLEIPRQTLLFELLQQSYQTYINQDKQEAFFNFPNPFISICTAQYIDTSGKVRGLLTKDGIYLATSPLPIFPELNIIKEPGKNTITQIEKARELLSLLSRVIEQGLTLYAIWNNTVITFYPNSSSYYDIYLKQKQIARCYTQWLFYTFAKIYEHPQKSDIADFINFHTIIQPDMEISLPPRYFLENNPYLSNDGKWKIPHENMKPILEYHLYWIMNRNTDILDKYRSLISQPFYYQDITDFDKDSIETIGIWSKDSASPIQTDTVIIYKHPLPIEDQSEYLILVHNKVYWTKNHKTLKEATDQAKKWLGILNIDIAYYLYLQKDSILYQWIVQQSDNNQVNPPIFAIFMIRNDTGFYYLSMIAPEYKQHKHIPQTNKYQMIVIEGDGNCLYRALSFLQYKNQDRHIDIRKDIIQFVKTHYNLSGTILDDRVIFAEDSEEGYKNWGDWIQQQEKDGVWGDAITIELASRLYKKHIRVIATNTQYTFGNEENEQWILQYAGSNHYNVLLPRI